MSYTWVGVGTLEVADEDRTEIAPAADAARLELLKPSSGRARQKQGKVLDGEVIIRCPSPRGEVVVLEPVVQVGLAIILGDVRRRSKMPRVGGCSNRYPEHQGAEVI